MTESQANESDRVAERVIAMLKGVAAGMEEARRWQFYGQLLAAVGEIRMTIGGPLPESQIANRNLQIGARLSDFDLEHVGEIVADRGDGSRFTNFGSHVLRLAKKADAEQRLVLGLVYPDHVRALDLWESSRPGSRLWRCPKCGTLNATFPGVEAHPATCLGCLGRTEPERARAR